MTSLAEANNAAPGRWVLMPQKGHRILDPRERTRFRARRRRRQVFMVLLEATALTLIMGLFPPLRPMLYGTVVLSLLLLVYVAFLVQARAHEVEQARVRRAREARRAATGAEPLRGRHAPRQAPARRMPTGPAAFVPRGSEAGGNGRRTVEGRGGEALRSLGIAGGESSFLREGGVRIIDDDVHVIVYRSDEIQVGELRAAAAR